MGLVDFMDPNGRNGLARTPQKTGSTPLRQPGRSEQSYSLMDYRRLLSVLVRVSPC